MNAPVTKRTVFGALVYRAVFPHVHAEVVQVFTTVEKQEHRRHAGGVPGSALPDDQKS
jgi:hypothetical protein